jgi:hypothetical protein
MPGDHSERDLLDELRALDAADRDAAAVDWSALERSIRDAVGTEVPRPWWRRWRWIVPGAAALATAAAVVALVVRAPSQELGMQPVAAISPDAAPAAASGESAPAVLRLDGTDVALGAAGSSGSDDELDDVLDALDDLEATRLRGAGDPVELVVSDLRWIDYLDEEVLEDVESELDREAVRRKKRG